MSPRLCPYPSLIPERVLILDLVLHRGIKHVNNNQFIGELEGGRRNIAPSKVRGQVLGVLFVLWLP